MILPHIGKLHCRCCWNPQWSSHIARPLGVKVVMLGGWGKIKVSFDPKENLIQCNKR